MDITSVAITEGIFGPDG